MLFAYCGRINANSSSSLLRPSKIMMSISRTNAAVSAVQMFIRLQEDGENWPQHQSASVTKSSERY